MKNPLIGQAAPAQYEQQLLKKQLDTQREFASLYDGELEVFDSPPSHYRMRAEFKIWHDGDISSYAMYEPGEYKKPVIISEFSIGSDKICELMPKLLKHINANHILRKKLFQVEFLTCLSGDALITMIYHKALSDEWQAGAEQLQSELGVPIIGRSRKQKRVLTRDYVVEVLDLKPATLHYQQIETGFTQPNANVCRHMLNWAYEQCIDLPDGDLLELYCGNGNFTIPLSFAFNRVLATEVSKISTQSALINIQKNMRTNIDIIRLSAEEVSEAFSGKREFKRLKNIDIFNYAFSTVFVDPPRAGLDASTESFISSFDNILYVSCNPETLKQNLENLTKTHTIKNIALFDQFPYTKHRECGVFLQKR